MFVFNVEQYVPKFILADKNGYAIAKAIEAAMQIVNDTIHKGLKTVYDFDEMPEWRLDELAWETNCLYDYGADIETKRSWIRNAIPLYRLYGTPEAIYQYVGSYFDDLQVEENWEYGGEPYHFRVTVDGEWTLENEAWARKTIEAAKNIRSVLDDLQIGSQCFVGIMAEGEVLARFQYPMAETERYAGQWPTENLIGIIDEDMAAGMQAELTGYPFDYPLAGTAPETNTLGTLDETEIHAAQSEDICYQIMYKMCGQDEI